jgi:hypothetical protein
MMSHNTLCTADTEALARHAFQLQPLEHLVLLSYWDFYKRLLSFKLPERRVKMSHVWNQTGWCSCDTLDLHAGSTQFSSKQDH